MTYRSAVLKVVATCGTAAGLCLLLVGVLGYLLGYNYADGSQIHVNLVPISLFAGFGPAADSRLCLSRYPEAVPRFPSALGILALSALALFFVALYIKQVSGLIAIRADIINWSESPVVDYIIRFRAGQPQFTPPEDANGFAYTPGAPLRFGYLWGCAVGQLTAVPYW